MEKIDMKKYTDIIVTVFLLFCIPVMLTAQGKIKTMIVTGQDNSHWWEGGSDAIQMILDNSDLFTVDIHKTPDWGEDIKTYNPDFKKYDLVIINYAGNTWSESTRKNFEEYVSNGGGVVIVHSAITRMADWKAYNEMVGMAGWNGRNEKSGSYIYWKDGHVVYDDTPGSAGNHGLQHQSTITHRITDHPILKDLPSVWTHFKDEVYVRMRGPGKNMEILATTYEDMGNNLGKQHVPVLWTVRYGKGRVFVTLLGHAGNDPKLRYSMECAGFQITLLRGSEWAATGKVIQKAPEDFPREGIISLRKEFTERQR